MECGVRFFMGLFYYFGLTYGLVSWVVSPFLIDAILLYSILGAVRCTIYESQIH